VYVSEHPFVQAARALEPHLSCRLAEVSAEMAGRDLVLGGTVIATRSLSTRAGRAFLAATIEDETGGSLELTVWPDTYEQTRDIWQTGTPVLATVRVRAKDERLQLGVQKAVAYVEGEFDPSTLLRTGPSSLLRAGKLRMADGRSRVRGPRGRMAPSLRSRAGMRPYTATEAGKPRLRADG